MEIPEEAHLLRVFIGEKDHYKSKPLYEAIVHKAHSLNLAGSTVLKGIMGFGANSRLHTSSILSLSEDMPIVIEIVDTKEKIDSIMPYLDEVVEEGLITLEKMNIIRYRHKVI